MNINCIVSFAKYCILVMFTAAAFLLRAQDTVYIVRKTETLEEVVVRRNNSAYVRELERVRKIYPYALQVADILDEYDKELGLINTKRKKKKFSKQAHHQLKEDYNYVIRDLYHSEGILLMKLIHRETGLTVKEIIARYRGKFNAGIYDKLAGIWDQDLNIKYDPEGADQLTESIVKEIEEELVEFDNTPKMVSKEEYKVNMKEYRQEVKSYKKAEKEYKKQQKQQKKSQKNTP